MAEDGWDVAHIAFWGLEGYPIELDCGQFGKRFEGKKVKVYPRMNDVWGTDALVEHGSRWGADVTFTMQDIWTLDINQLMRVRNWIPYLPVDKDPTPATVLSKLPPAYRIISMSQFGHDMLANSGYASHLIKEGTDPSIFKPADRQDARKKLGIDPNIFLFGMIAANKENPPRKGFQEALLAFKTFYQKHPEAALYVHSQQQTPTGFPILQFARYLEIAHRVIFLDPYISVYGADSQYTAGEFNAFDVLMHPSQTEGFGLTVVGAAAGGVPSIVPYCTSMPEMIIDGKTGYIAKTQYKRFTADESFVYAADPDSVYEQMERAYADIKKDRKKVEKNCREHIV